MSKRAQVCRTVVVLYLGFLMVLTLYQFYGLLSRPLSPLIAPLPSWLPLPQSGPWLPDRMSLIRFAVSCGLWLRFAILAVFVWKVLTKPKTWSLVLGLLFAVGAMVAPTQLYLHSHQCSIPLILLAGIAVSRTTVMWLLCVAPVICAACCFTLRKNLCQEEPNQAPDRMPGANAQGEGSRH
jgi:hypothetical protein